MRRIPLLTLLCALLLGAFFPAVLFPTAAHADVTQNFYADSLSSLDSCPHGITKGTITWHVVGGPSGIAWADLGGGLLDRPLPADPGRACPNDGYYSVGRYTAYSVTGVVQTVTVKADNQSLPINFTLGSNTTRIVRIEIQVCRNPLVTLPPSYCGKAQTYNAPPVV